MSGDTGLQLMELRDFTKTVEAEMGRQNWLSPAGETFSLRCLDLDILTYGDTVSQNPELPRSDLIKYPFVIRPVLELCPDFMMPGRGRYLRDLVSLEGMEILDTVPELDLAALAGPASGRIGDFPGAGGSTLPRPALTQI
jgi:2-amino-4-hydroxy-6-hydroxymethyldihydropteridine diphosphokinase